MKRYIDKNDNFNPLRGESFFYRSYRFIVSSLIVVCAR